MSAPFAVEAVGLVKRFPKQPGWRNLLRAGEEKTALQGVTLHVPRGQAFGLLGPNGAGKSTLIKIFCSLVLPTAGTARVGGQDVVRQAHRVRQRIGLVYGDARSFFWRLSLWENMRFYAALYGLDANIARRRIDELLDAVGLSDAANTHMHYFSSGMKQRAAIARGLLSDPDVIFLDEPTTSVDPLGAYEIRRMIRDRVVAGGRRTVILTTNVMEEAEFICDGVALLDRGRIELVGDVETLRRRFQPDERYRLTITNHLTWDPEQLRALPGVLDVATVASDRDRRDLILTVRRGSRAVPEAVRRLVSESHEVWSCAKEELSLDEMFRLAFGTQRERVEPAAGAPL